MQNPTHHPEPVTIGFRPIGFHTSPPTRSLT